MELATAGALIGRVALFRDVPVERRRSVLKRMTILQFPDATTILDEKRPLKTLFVVASGGVQVLRRDPATGLTFLMRTLSPGDSFGETHLLAGTPWSGCAVTMGETVLFCLDRASFDQVMQEQPEVAGVADRLLSARRDGELADLAVPVREAAALEIDPVAFKLVPLSLVRMHRLLPVARRGRVVTLAMVNPGDLIAFDDLGRVLRDVVYERVRVSPEDFDALMNRVAPTPKKKGAIGGKLAEVEDELTPVEPPKVGHIDDLMGTVEGELVETVREEEEAGEVSLTDLEVQVESGPIVKLANNLLLLALREGASDIHVEPQGKGIVVRYRIDGNLRVIQTLPKQLLTGLVSRLKILACMDITVRRIPQDGRISFMYKARRIDFRVNTVPTKFGEKVCMRVLDNSLAGITLDKLMSDPGSLARWRQIINEPYGIVFVTGPTGSGKTTTLYSSLGELNTPDVNISTVEDPVEYDLPGLNQIQVDKPSGMDFAKVLRAFLRQDPDIILVGETRDTETAKISIEAALTGHLVFTTLHTNSAAASFMRLDEMGVEPFLVSCATVGLVAQRLARRLCSKCKEPVAPNPEMARYCGFADGELTQVWRGTGCEACGGRGAKGRVGIYEVMLLDDDLKAMVSRKERPELIHAAAVEKGMLDLPAYARMLVRDGAVSMEEVVSVVSFR